MIANETFWPLMGPTSARAAPSLGCPTLAARRARSSEIIWPTSARTSSGFSPERMSHAIEMHWERSSR